MEEKRNKPKKDARLLTLQRDGLLFRIINVIMSDDGKRHYFQSQQPYDRNALDSHDAYLEEYKALHSIYNSNDASLGSIAKSLYPSFNEHFGNEYEDDRYTLFVVRGLSGKSQLFFPPYSLTQFVLVLQLLFRDCLV